MLGIPRLPAGGCGPPKELRLKGAALELRSAPLVDFQGSWSRANFLKSNFKRKGAAFHVAAAENLTKNFKFLNKNN
jgi:hypothetical protein